MTNPFKPSPHASVVFDYAIFVHCVTGARLHDYFNGLLQMQILFA
jgi:hypothetical protein